MTRVLLLHSSAGRYGADRQLALIARGLDPAPLVVLPSGGPLAEDLRAGGIEVLERPGLAVLRRALMRPSGLSRLAASVAADAGWLRHVVRTREIDLVHSNTSVILAGAGGARLAGVPHVWHVREIYSRFGRAWPVYRRALLTAAALPCVSSATAAQFGAPPPPAVEVLRDGLAVDVRRAPAGTARAVLGLPEDVPVVAVLGRISDWKGQDVLVRALAAPALAECGTVGILAGDPWPGAEDRLTAVHDLARELGVADRLRVIGFRPDLEHVLGAADVVAVPSTAPDPLPNSALEAAAAGCAVVAANHGGLPEIIRDGETGRLFAPGDATELARMTRDLIDAPDTRAALGAAAAVDVRARFSADRMLRELRSLYASLSR